MSSFTPLLSIALLVAPLSIPLPAAPEGTPERTPVSTVDQPESQTYAVGAVAVTDVTRDDYSAEAAPPSPPPPPASTPTAGQRSFAVAPPMGRDGASIVAFAMQFVDKVPWGQGAHPSDSFSCDGLVQYVFAAHGVSLPRIVGNQAARGVPISAAEAQPGDLVVWSDHSHIGIYAGNGMVIDSPYAGRMVSYRAIWPSSYYFVRIP